MLNMCNERIGDSHAEGSRMKVLMCERQDRVSSRGNLL